MATSDNWEQYLRQGYIPGGTTAGVRDRVRIDNREDLYQHLLNQAGQSGFGNYTQQDIYDFFIRPQEAAAMADADNRFRALYGQAQRASQQRSGQLANRLGFGGTGMGARMARSVAGGSGGLAASRGLAAARKSAADQINQPGRLSRIEDLLSTARTTDQRQAEEEGTAVGAGLGATSAALGGIASGLLAASAGPQAVVTVPAAAIAALMAGSGVAGGLGSALSPLAKNEAMKRSDERVRKFRGGPLRTAEFKADPVPGGGGIDFNPMGSQAALSNAYRGNTNDESGNFLY